MTFFKLNIFYYWSIVIAIVLVSCSRPICDERLTYTVIVKPGVEGKDASISSFYPDSNYATSKSLNAIAYTFFRRPQYVEACYLDFDIDKIIPVKAKIKQAELKLYADTTNLFELMAGHIDYHKLDKWSVTLVTSQWDEYSITWLNQPEEDKDVYAQLPRPESSSQLFSIDATEYVKRKLKSSEKVYGLKIKLASGDIIAPTIAIRFCSSDHQYSELWPELKIEYTME